MLLMVFLSNLEAKIRKKFRGKEDTQLLNARCPASVLKSFQIHQAIICIMVFLC
jgi:hypothetical protein